MQPRLGANTWLQEMWNIRIPSKEVNTFERGEAGEHLRSRSNSGKVRYVSRNRKRGKVVLPPAQSPVSKVKGCFWLENMFVPWAPLESTCTLYNRESCLQSDPTHGWITTMIILNVWRELFEKRDLVNGDDWWVCTACTTSSPLGKARSARSPNVSGVQERQEASLGHAPLRCNLQKWEGSKLPLEVKMVQLLVALFLVGQALGQPSQTQPPLPSNPFSYRYPHYVAI